MRKSILFVTSQCIDGNTNDGITKKILGQVRAFENLGCEIDFVHRTSEGAKANIGNIVFESRKKIVKKIFFLIWIIYILKKNNSKYDLLYLRNIDAQCNVLFLLFFVFCIRFMVDKIVIEIPTYPYFSELKTKKEKFFNLFYRLYLPFINKNVFAFTYMGKKQEKIWGRPAVRIINCVDVKHIKYSELKVNKEGSVIKFIGVAGLAYWHGYDRLIKSIIENEGNGYKFEFHIVGDYEPEFSRLRSIAGSNPNIFFYGRKTQVELDQIFLEMDIAVDSLGRHRSGLNYNCSLKSKEYVARNMPFIKSHNDDAFDQVDFVYNVSANDENIDLEDIAEWYKNLIPGNRIRYYAEENFNWERQFLKVFSAINFLELNSSNVS